MKNIMKLFLYAALPLALIALGSCSYPKNITFKADSQTGALSGLYLTSDTSMNWILRIIHASERTRSPLDRPRPPMSTTLNAAQSTAVRIRSLVSAGVTILASMSMSVTYTTAVSVHVTAR